MKKIKEMLLFFMCITVLCSCNRTLKHEKIASRVVSTGKATYIEVDGKPFTYTGIQLRTDAFMNCEYKTADQLEPYFKAAADLNINTIQLPIDWNDIETHFDYYEFSVIETFLNFALKYNLKVEFLWFSTNMCGDTHSYHIPEYIIDDDVTYPRFESSYTGQFWMYYGYILHLEFGNDNLLAREIKVIKKLMNFIIEWEKKNNNPNVLIGVQVHNEPDFFPFWRVASGQISVKKNGVQITYEEAVATVNKALNEVGKAFKSTPYKLITRVNFISVHYMSSEFGEDVVRKYIKDVFELDGIDIVGDDPHNSNVEIIKDVIKNKYALVGNYPHIAENHARYENIPSLILSALANGGGYIMYEVATSTFFIKYEPNPAVDPDSGIYNSDLTPKAHTKDVKEFLGMINDLGGSLVTIGRDNIKTFNIENNDPVAEYYCDVMLKKMHIRFETTNGAIGCLLNCGDYLLVCANKASTLSGLDNNCVVTKGQFITEVWEVEKEVNIVSNKLELEKCGVYKIII